MRSYFRADAFLTGWLKSGTQEQVNVQPTHWREWEDARSALFSLLKRGIMGTWHKVSVKHLAAYLDEMTFRFNNRKNDFIFRDTMLKLIGSTNLEYKELTAKVENAA